MRGDKAVPGSDQGMIGQGRFLDKHIQASSGNAAFVYDQYAIAHVENFGQV